MIINYTSMQGVERTAYRPITVAALTDLPGEKWVKFSQFVETFSNVNIFESSIYEVYNCKLWYFDKSACLY